MATWVWRWAMSRRGRHGSYYLQPTNDAVPILVGAQESSLCTGLSIAAECMYSNIRTPAQHTLRFHSFSKLEPGSVMLAGLCRGHPPPSALRRAPFALCLWRVTALALEPLGTTTKVAAWGYLGAAGASDP